MLWCYIRKNLLRRKARSLSTILIIALIVSTIAGFSISTRSAEYAVLHVISGYMGEADISVFNATGYLSIDVANEILNIGGVEAVDYVLNFYGAIMFGNKSLLTTFICVNINGFYAEKVLGDMRFELNKNGVCIITSPIADELKVNISDNLTAFMYFKNYFKLTTLSVSGILQWEKKWMWDYPRIEVYLSLDYVYKLFSISNIVSQIYVKVKPGYNIVEIGDKIKKMYPSLNVYYPDIQYVRGFEQSFLSDTAFIIAFAIILLVIICYLNIEERRTEIGTLKVLGLSNASLILSLIVEIMLLAIIGVIVGIGLSFVFVFLFNSLYQRVLMLAIPIPIIVTAKDFVSSILIGIIVPIFSTLLMSAIVAKIKPAEVMRVLTSIREIKIGKGLIIQGIIFLILGIITIFVKQLAPQLWWARITGLLILPSALFLYYFEKPLGLMFEKIAGIAGRLAVVFSKRRIGMSIVICIILGMALNWLIITNTIGIGYDEAGKKIAFEEMNFQLVITFSTPVPWTVEEDIMKVRGVEDILSVGWLGYVPLYGKNISISIAVVELKKLRYFLRSEVLNGSWDQLSNTSAVVYTTITFSRELRRILGTNLYKKQIGLMTEVKKNVNITIDVVLKSYISISWFYAGPVSLGCSVFVDKDFAKKYFPYMYRFCLFAMLVKVKEGYSPKQVLEEIRNTLGKNLVSGFTLEDWYEEGKKISFAYSVFYYLIGYIIALIAMIMMFIVQMRNISIWRLELGTLRAYGLTRRQLLGIFILQALVLTIPTFIAIAISYPFDAQAMFLMFKMIGIEIPLILDWVSLIFFTIILASVLTIASVIPAVKIVRMPIRETLIVE